MIAELAVLFGRSASCVAVVAVVRLGCEPAVNVVAIAHQKSARVGSVLLNPISVRVLREEPRALDANF